jgi:hypothetical protein
MTEAPEPGGVAVRRADAIDTYLSDTDVDEVTDRAEAVVREARRRQRRRHLWFAVAAVLAALATVAALAAAGTFGGEGSSGHRSARTSPSSKAASTKGISREALQFRPSSLSAPRSSGDCSSKTARMPPASRAAWVEWLGGCIHDGPAILTISAVRSVTAGYSCSGNVWVKVQLAPSEIGRFDRMVRREETSTVGSVLLDRQLSIYTGDLEHTPAALAGDVQLLGGLSAKSPLPREIARALGRPLQWTSEVRGGRISYC